MAERVTPLDELVALYREVDALYVGARCPASSECCRFGITGREPQVTSVEIALLERALAQRGGKLSARRRALPLAQASKQRSKTARGTREPRALSLVDERTCPLLEQPGRCAVYEARPLGCRTFYCERAELEPPARRALSDVVRQLQAIALRHAPDGDRPRALTRALSG